MYFFQDYLTRFYNFSLEIIPMTKMKVSTNLMEKKIEEMQQFLGLNVTGQLDKSTLDMMRRPRCGVPDVHPFRTMPGRPVWKKHFITYRWHRSHVFFYFLIGLTSRNLNHLDIALNLVADKKPYSTVNTIPLLKLIIPGRGFFIQELFDLPVQTRLRRLRMKG